MASDACKICKKQGSDGTTLKRCQRCKSEWYCSRECQKADWKTHKKFCAQQANENTNPASDNTGGTSSSSSRRPPKNLSAAIEKPFHALHSRTWLHTRPEQDVYKLLIDAYRLRLDDDYKLTGEADMDSIYGGELDSRAGFRQFLSQAESRPGLLPAWWTSEKARQCMRFGMQEDWSSLACAVEKSDIVEHYGDPQMPMQMRMLGEQIIGSGPGGQSGDEMMRIMMQMESGGMTTTHLDLSSNLSRR